MRSDRVTDAFSRTAAGVAALALSAAEAPAAVPTSPIRTPADRIVEVVVNRTLDSIEADRDPTDEDYAAVARMAEKLKAAIEADPSVAFEVAAGLGRLDLVPTDRHPCVPSLPPPFELLAPPAGPGPKNEFGGNRKARRAAAAEARRARKRLR